MNAKESRLFEQLRRSIFKTNTIIRELQKYLSRQEFDADDFILIEIRDEE